MPQTNNITIQFKPDGDDKLLKALKNLAAAQRTLNKEIHKAGNAVDKQRQRVEKNSDQLKKNNTLVNQAKAGIAQYRNTLLLAAFAMGLFSKTVGRLTSLFAEQEAAEKKLSTALGFTSQALLDFASAQQQITTFGDEVTIAAMAQAAAFTKNEDAIKQMTIAAQNLAAGRGMDLNTAMDLISKSVFSSTNALSRYGIEIGKTNSRSERLNSILQKVNQQYGGQASAQVDTYAGATQQLANTWGDLGEKFGAVLAEGLLPLVKALNGLATILQALSPVLGLIIQSFTAIGLALLLTSQRLAAVALNAKKTATAFFTLNKGTKALTVGIKGLRGVLSFGLFFLIDGVSKLMGNYSKETESAKVETVQLVEGIRDLSREFASRTTMKQLKELMNLTDDLISSFSTLTEEEKKLIERGNLGFVFDEGGLESYRNQVKIVTEELDRLRGNFTGQISKIIDPKHNEKIEALEKELAILEGLINKEEKLIALGLNKKKIQEKIDALELENLSFVSAIIPRLELQNELLENKNKFSGAELELENLLSDARARGIDTKTLDIDSIKKLINEKTKLTNVMKTELFITSSFNKAILDGINNNARFAESFANMVKKMAAEITAHMVTFMLFKTLMPGSSLFAGFTNPLQYAISQLTGTSPVGAGSAMQGVALESQNAAMQGGSGSIVVNFSGNVLSQDFIENDAIPAIKQAVRRGADIGVS